VRVALELLSSRLLSCSGVLVSPELFLGGTLERVDVSTQYNVENVTIATFSKFLDHILDNILDDILNILNDHVPKYKNKKHKYPVWFTPQIIKNVQIKNKLRRRYMKFKNPEDLVSFRELRGSIKSDISLAYKEFVASSERNIKALYQYRKCIRENTHFLPINNIFNLQF
jgi:hypothetical protein